MSFLIHKSFVHLRNTIKNILAQKSMKSIVKKYFCHQWFNLNFMKWQEYFLYAKKIKITTLFYNSSHLRHILENIRWTQTEYAVLCQPYHTDTLFLLNNNLNKVIFILFSYKKYSLCVIKFRLNHWWKMDCFNDVLILRFCALTM